MEKENKDEWVEKLFLAIENIEEGSDKFILLTIALLMFGGVLLVPFYGPTFALVFLMLIMCFALTAKAIQRGDNHKKDEGEVDSDD